jgi:hypothetical protein
MTHAELMRHALSQALRRVHIGPKKLKLDEETRWQIAGEAVEELRRYGGSNGFFNAIQLPRSKAPLRAFDAYICCRT